MVVFIRSVLLFFFLLITKLSQAGQSPFPVGARAAGLAGASVTLADVWAVRNNVAGIAGMEKSTVGLFAENRYDIPAFTTVGLQAVYVTPKYGSIGLDIARFGDQLYNEQRLGVGYGHRLGTVNIGIKADVLQTRIESLGSERALALSLGGQSEVIPHLVFAAYIFNINQARLTAAEDERVPTVMHVGMSYQPITRVLLLTEAEKDLEYPVNVKAGLEYRVVDKLALRVGVASATEQFSFGTGFQAKKLQFDYGFGRQSVLGNLHQVAIAYKFE